MDELLKHKWLIFDIYNRLWDSDVERVYTLGLVPDMYYFKRLMMIQNDAFGGSVQEFYQLIVQSIQNEGYHENLEADCGHFGRWINLNFMPTKHGFGYYCQYCEDNRCKKCGVQFHTDIHHHRCTYICGKCGTMPCADNPIDCVCGKTHCANVNGRRTQCIECKKYQCIYSDKLVNFINGKCFSCQ